MIRVVLVDDHGLFRAGVRAELEGRVDVVGEAADATSAIAVITEHKPDVVLLDVHMPGGGGALVPPAVHETEPGVRFLALSVSDVPEDVIAVIRAGARGYVTKNIATDDLIDAIERVNAGDAVFRRAWPVSSLMLFLQHPARLPTTKWIAFRPGRRRCCS